MLKEAQTLLLLLLLATLASVAAHPSASLPSHPSCTSSPRPTAYSFHVHVTFDDAAGSSSRREALSLRSAFAAKFGVSAAPINPATCDDTNTVSMPLHLSPPDHSHPRVFNANELVTVPMLPMVATRIASRYYPFFRAVAYLLSTYEYPPRPPPPPHRHTATSPLNRPTGKARPCASSTTTGGQRILPPVTTAPPPAPLRPPSGPPSSPPRGTTRYV